MRRFLAPPPPTPVEPGRPPTFSVLIAAYQAAETIGGAVESALGQTVPPLEVIVCDDGSTDGTEDALEAYRDRIVFLRQENRGAAAARNAGISVSSGEFVAVLDADDAYEPERLEALGQLAAERPDLDLLATDTALEVGGRVVGRFSDWNPFVVDDQRAALLERCFVAAPAVRRARILEAGGFSSGLEPAEDWDLWLRLVLHGARIGFVDEPLYRYRMAEGGLTSDRPRSLRSRVLMLEDAAENPDLLPEERSLVHRLVRHQARQALLADAEEGLRVAAADRRRRSLAVALGAGFSPRTRLKALAAALAPGLAARRLAEREARTGATRLKRPELDG